MIPCRFIHRAQLRLWSGKKECILRISSSVGSRKT